METNSLHSHFDKSSFNYFQIVIESHLLSLYCCSNFRIKFWHIFLLLSSVCNTFGQSIDPSSKYKYWLTSELEDSIAHNNPIITRRATHYLVSSGNYLKSMEYQKYPVDLRWGFDSLSIEQLEFISKYHCVNARDFILEEAIHKQIVILNEAHSVPLHRVFTRSLLRKFYDQGFRYFGLEGLINCDLFPPEVPCDTLLNQRGYPLNAEGSGVYVQEPQMGNLIREALTLGYMVFSYEGHGIDDIITRDYIQAENIASVLGKDPDAKILLHCGYGHLIEIPDKSAYPGKLMGYHLKELTGIDPLTVNQYILTEAKQELEVPLYNHIDCDEPSVLINDKGEIFKGFEVTGQWDILVYHPRTKYIQGRPDWLLRIPENRMYELDTGLIDIEFPCLVKAHVIAEKEMGVPVDVIEVVDKDDEVFLVLPPGEYYLEVINQEGERQELEVGVR